MRYVTYYAVALLGLVMWCMGINIHPSFFTIITTIISVNNES